MSEWLTIGELCDRSAVLIQTGPFGSQLHAHEYCRTGTPVIPTEAIGRRRILNVELPHVGAEVAQRLARHRLRSGDILFARRGAQATGFSALVKPEHAGSLCGTGAILLRTISEGIDQTYLSFALSAPQTIAWLKENAVGAVMPNLNADVIRRVRVWLPNIHVQRAIASILGVLDERIELNCRMNETLEAMARALFRSWFVDFDPVHAKLEGRQPAGIDDATARLFASSFDEANSVPAGWKASTWGEIATLEYGKALREYGEKKGNFPVYGTNGRIGFHTGYLSPSEGVIIGRKGAYRGVHFSHRPFFVIDTAFYLKPSSDFDLRWAYYELLRTNINEMDSGSAIPSTSRDAFYRIPVSVPPRAIQSRFRQALDPLWARQAQMEEESAQLAALRDTLLPKLLSGELRLPEAETIVGKAL